MVDSYILFCNDRWLTVHITCWRESHALNIQHLGSVHNINNHPQYLAISLLHLGRCDTRLLPLRVSIILNSTNLFDDITIQQSDHIETCLSEHYKEHHCLKFSSHPLTKSTKGLTMRSHTTAKQTPHKYLLECFIVESILCWEVSYCKIGNVLPINWVECLHGLDSGTKWTTPTSTSRFVTIRNQTQQTVLGELQKPR